jgi:3-dehydroquinate dehydratase II
MTRSIPILNGPDPNLLGQREPEIYGRTALAEAARLDVEECPQINSEGELVTSVQEVPGQFAGLGLNAGAYSHTSIALRALNEPLIEVHLSNIYQRETFRQQASVSLAAKGIICGFGSQGYLMALGALVAMLDDAH